MKRLILIASMTLSLGGLILMSGCGGDGSDFSADGGDTDETVQYVDTGSENDSADDWDTNSPIGSDSNDGLEDTDTSDGTDSESQDTGSEGEGQDTETEEPICGEQGLDLELAGLNVMLLMDRSGSMLLNNRWESSKNAVKQFVTDSAHKDTWFGLHPFPGSLLNICQPYENPTVDLGPGTGSEIVSWMGEFFNHPVFGSSTPMVKVLQHYLGTESTPLHDKTKSNYLVLLSDGADTCYDGGGSWASPNLLAGIVDDLKDISGIKTIPIGLGTDVSGKELNAVAKNGGSPFSEYIRASTDDLTVAFEKIAQSIRPCTYLIEAPSQGWDSSRVNFYFDGNLVERDRAHKDGWDWTKGDLLEVEFHGQKCELIQSGKVAAVEAKFGCPTQMNGSVCAKHDAYLSFPDNAVLVLMDVSGSMGSGNKWNHAATALTNMLVDDRNNHIEFGFDPFPSSNSCDVAVSPKFTVGGQLNHLPIIQWAAGKKPISLSGSTPLLAVLKRLINRPGRIADKDVSGSVIVISDGADTCYKPHEAVPTELHSTVKKAVELHDIRVFAIGFGNLNQDAQNQLNAIATAGNTGVQTYMQANNQEDLDRLFRQISSMVTSCVFDVPYAGTQVNYKDVNFYLDGNPVPRDNTGSNGWNWVNEVKKDQVEFHGTHCEELKAGNITDVVVEFGCPTIVV